MKFEKNIKKLEAFRLKVKNLKSKEDTKIENLLKWRENLIKKSKASSKLINFNEVKGWHSDSNGNIHHKSGQFFSLQGVRTRGASSREVQTWDQPILCQKHGGILAFLARETKEHGIQFLLEGKTEPGDNGDVKFCPSFQATQSNINRAHGGKLPNLSNIVLNYKGAQLIYATSHNEDQVPHLHVNDQSICINRCKEEYGNPCQNFCPANVYEVIDDGEERLQINFSNCVHCKTCDIMDPYQIIDWVTPEGGDGPSWKNM